MTFASLNWLEIIAVAWGILTVYLTVRQNNWCWPVGSASNVLFAVIFFRERLYADMALQVIYIGLNFYGWYQWLHGGAGNSALAVARAPAQARLVLATLSVASIAILGTALARFTNADLAYWDSTTTILSLAAQYMLARKWIENWGVWITVNVLYIGLYAYKGLYLTSAQQLVFIALSIAGYLSWRRELRAAHLASPSALDVA